jgi:hypothetical protein
MSLVEALFTLLLGYHSVHVGSTYATENLDQQHARLHDIAEANVEACRAHPLWYFLHGKRIEWPLLGCVAMGATTEKWESGFLVEIHSGEKLGPAGERGLPQLHRLVTQIPDRRWAISYDEWKKIGGLGLEKTQYATDLMLRVIGWHVYRCQIPFKGGDLFQAARLFAEYHHPSGFPCATYDEKHGGAAVLPKGSVPVSLLVSRRNATKATRGIGMGLDTMSLRRADSYQRLFWDLKRAMKDGP